MATVSLLPYRPKKSAIFAFNGSTRLLISAIHLLSCSCVRLGPFQCARVPRITGSSFVGSVATVV
jgi:hypothetical protein